MIRVIDDECRLPFWYIEVFAYYVCSLVYLCRSLLEQQIELVLITLLFEVLSVSNDSFRLQETV